MQQYDLLLASQSPRRRELLTQIGVRFEVVNVDVAEIRETGELPVTYVQRLAKAKAKAGFEEHLNANPRTINKDEDTDGHRIAALGADTIVVLGDKVLEKPRDKADAIKMLSALSDKTHEVFTSVAICGDRGVEQKTVSTWVRFGRLSDDDILEYWQSGEPKDKAGAYGIQGFGATFVKSIEGSYSNVVGLPLYETAKLLTKFKVPVGCSYISSL